MRTTIIAIAAGLLLLPAAPVFACGAAAKVQAAATELSAAKKKPMQKAVKKTKEKVEYMRAVPTK